jgi:hypothetical protein
LKKWETPEAKLKEAPVLPVEIFISQTRTYVKTAFYINKCMIGAL